MTRALLEQALAALILAPQSTEVKAAINAIRAELAKPVTCYRCGKTSNPEFFHTCSQRREMTVSKNKDDLP